jgi:hypothetical protein
MMAQIYCVTHVNAMYDQVEMREKYQFYGILVYCNIITSCNTIQLYSAIPELNA